MRESVERRRREQRERLHPSKSSLNKPLLALLGLVLVSGAVATIVTYVAHRPSPMSTTEHNKPVAAQQSQKLTFAAMGDMLAHNSVLQGAQIDSGYDFTRYFKLVRPTYQSSDAVFCNQEGLSAGPAYGITGYPSFNGPSEFSRDLRNGAGCDVINLANNHMGDKGPEATNATLDVWSALKPLVVSGANKSEAEQQEVHYFTKNGIKTAFLSFADFNNNKTTPAYSINIYHDSALLEKLVKRARAQADAVVVSLHWGTEDSAVINDDQRQTAAKLADLGVDVIIGTGPHVLQSTEWLTRADGAKMLVWYSLGNLLSAQLTLSERIGGVALFDLVRQSDKKVVVQAPRFVPTYMHYTWTPEQEAVEDFASRKDLMVYPLKDAAPQLAEARFASTVQAQMEYVKTTLGTDVSVVDK